MRKICVLIALAVTTSGATANPSVAALYGVEFDPALPTATHPGGLISANGELSPLLPQARACFERPAAQALVRFTIGLSSDALRHLPMSLGFLHAWLRSTCPIAVTQD